MENRKREKGAPFIEIKDLSYAYPGEEGRGQQVLSHISLTIREGEYTVILGHNGSGKSTLAKLINLVIDDYTYAEGQILVGGRDVMADDLTEEDLLELRRQVGMVFQNPDNQLVATIVEEDVAFGPENLGIPNPELRERVDAALATVGMSEYAHHEPHRLSGGQKRRVAIAGIMAMRPEVLVLDEPAAGLDPQGRRDIFGGIRAYNRKTGSTVVIVSHSMEDMAQYCDDVAVMAHARLLMTGTRDEVFARADELEAVGLDIPVITKLSALLRQGGMPLDPGLYTLEAAEAALAQVFGLPADREGGRKR